jgi:FkbM family methyltransferase
MPYHQLKKFLSKLNHARLDKRHLAKLLERKQIFSSNYGEFAKGILLDTEQGLFVVNPADIGVSKELMTKGRYGSGEIARALEYINQDSVCVIVGGHIGTLSVPISKACSELHAFEANPATYYLLDLNIKLNTCDNIHLHNLAASDKSGHLEFMMNEANSGASKRVPVHQHRAFVYDKPQQVRVESVALDDFLHVESVDLLFMDIEGSEYFALKGAQKLLEKTKVLITEFYPDHIKLVANVTAEDFWNQLKNHFSVMLEPLNNKEFVGEENILKELNRIIEDWESHENLIFIK